MINRRVATISMPFLNRQYHMSSMSFYPGNFLTSYLAETLVFLSTSILTAHRCVFDINYYHNDAFNYYDIHFPELLTNAAIRRKAEYLTGRIAAKYALNDLGYSNFILHSGLQREPLWPNGVIGSISHTHQQALAVATLPSKEILHGIGVDIEIPVTSEMAESIWSEIISPTEFIWLHTHPIPFSLAFTITFSAKESLFKMLYPTVRHYFDFLSARIVAINIGSNSFTLQLVTNLSPELKAGYCFRGTFYNKENAIVTVIGF